MKRKALLNWLGMALVGLTTQALLGAAEHASTIEGEAVDPFLDSTKSALVFLFVAVDCPISNRMAPAVNALFETYGSDEMAMWTIYTDKASNADAIQQHRGDYRYRIPALLDYEQVIAKRCGATVTPEAAVFVREGSNAYRLVYRGRIDNQYVAFGQWRLEPTQHDLREVLDAILEGRGDSLELRTTRAIGCYISPN